VIEILGKSENLAEFDRILIWLNWGIYTTALALAWKVCLGIITFSMVLSLYWKIVIIYQKEGFEKWQNTYQKWISACIVLGILLNISFVIYVCVNWSKGYPEYMEGFKVVVNAVKIYTHFSDWLDHRLNTMGVFMATQYFLLAFLYCGLLVKFFRLIDQPEL